MSESDLTYSDHAVAAGEALWRLYLLDAWPAHIESRFTVAREALADLARELNELDAAGDSALRNQPARERLEHYVRDEHIWPEGWQEARSYLPVDCPQCRRPRLLYALPIDTPVEGILVHCEKCRAASYDETTLGVDEDYVPASQRRKEPTLNFTEPEGREFRLVNCPAITNTGEPLTLTGNYRVAATVPASKSADGAERLLLRPIRPERRFGILKRPLGAATSADIYASLDQADASAA